MNPVIFEKPNANFEWEEAERYPEIFPTKAVWLKAMREGKEIDPESLGLVGKINNTEYEENLENMKRSYKTLTKDRRKRVEALFRANPVKIELPIVMKYNGEEYELVSGNTRLTMMGILHREIGFPVRVLLIEP